MSLSSEEQRLHAVRVPPLSNSYTWNHLDGVPGSANSRGRSVSSLHFTVLDINNDVIREKNTWQRREGSSRLRTLSLWPSVSLARSCKPSPAPLSAAKHPEAAQQMWGNELRGRPGDSQDSHMMTVARVCRSCSLHVRSSDGFFYYRGPET